MIPSKNACLAAAHSLFGLRNIGTAGPEWHAGCLIHNNYVYYSPYKATGSHHLPVNQGYLCTKKITKTDVDRLGVEKKSTYCGDQSIGDYDTCKYAASKLGMNYRGKAGPEWTPGKGCFVHDGQAYFMASGTASQIKVNDGNLCLKPESKKGALYPLDAQDR